MECKVDKIIHQFFKICIVLVHLLHRKKAKIQRDIQVRNMNESTDQVFEIVELNGTYTNIYLEHQENNDA